jgi:hypothetical protein
MLQDQFNHDYYIEQIDSPSQNFPYQYVLFRIFVTISISYLIDIVLKTNFND